MEGGAGEAKSGFSGYLVTGEENSDFRAIQLLVGAFCLTKSSVIISPKYRLPTGSAPILL